mgnify:CR=1 FL=1
MFVSLGNPAVCFLIPALKRPPQKDEKIVQLTSRPIKLKILINTDNAFNQRLSFVMNKQNYCRFYFHN